MAHVQFEHTQSTPTQPAAHASAAPMTATHARPMEIVSAAAPQLTLGSLVELGVSLSQDIMKAMKR